MNTETIQPGVDAEPTVEIVDLTSTALAHFSKTEAALADLRETYGGKVFDCTNNAGDGEARHARIVLKDARVNVEKLRKIVKEPYLEAGRKIDAEAKRITTEIEVLEEPIDAQIKAEERRRADLKAAEARAEAERLAKIDAIMRWLRERPGLYAAANLATLTSVVDEIATKSEAGFAHLGDGHEAIDQQVIVTLQQLNAMIDARIAADAESERLRLAKIEMGALQRAMDEQAAELKRQQEAIDAQRAEAQAIADEALLEALEAPAPKIGMLERLERNAALPVATVADVEAVMVDETNKAFGRLLRINALLDAARDAHLLLASLLPDHTTTIKLGNALSNLEE